MVEGDEEHSKLQSHYDPGTVIGTWRYFVRWWSSLRWNRTEVTGSIQSAEWCLVILRSGWRRGVGMACQCVHGT